ncbi:hypothetical protein [uncultured Caulobacter sp.]|uniref:hypothetical protein n=1 Tax=uncultured Caulobacter sp. TaxID=158749 RepID=UPI0026226952|nr:hypothetical protein [uncultured Caulobacter sp.]
MSLDEPAASASRPRKRSGPDQADGSRPAEARSWGARATSETTTTRQAVSPRKTFRLPGGKTMTLSTDRVRAKPAVTPQVSFMLGQNGIGLGLWGLLAPKGVNRFLGLKGSPQSTQLLFGAREMATGMALFSDPTKSSALWARVVGDMFDIAVLRGLTRRTNPQHRNARLALGVVLVVTALDVVAAVRMSGVKRNCE